MAGSPLFPIFQKGFKPKRPDPLQEIQQTLERTEEVQNRAKRKKNLLGSKETPGLTQMVLDAGQKVIGPIHCEECGLLYSPGDIQDEKEHRKAHARLDNLFSIRLWKNPKIVNDYPAEGSMIVQVDCKDEPKRILNVLKDFLEWIDSELGAIQDASGSRPTEKIYLYLFKSKRKNEYRVLGCAIAESLDPSKIVSGFIGSEGNGHNKPLVVGLTRLWTDAAFRKRHIAWRLCDAVRFNSSNMPGFIVSKSQFGILEPSEDGKSFMKRYSDGVGRFYTYAKS